MSHTVTVTTQACLVCGQPSMVMLEKTKYDRWVAGEHVQNVWPEWSADKRELLITGTHGPCWDKMFA